MDRRRGRLPSPARRLLLAPQDPARRLVRAGRRPWLRNERIHRRPVSRAARAFERRPPTGGDALLDHRRRGALRDRGPDDAPRGTHGNRRGSWKQTRRGSHGAQQPAPSPASRRLSRLGADSFRCGEGKDGRRRTRLRKSGKQSGRAGDGPNRSTLRRILGNVPRRWQARASR